MVEKIIFQKRDFKNEKIKKKRIFLQEMIDEMSKIR